MIILTVQATVTSDLRLSLTTESDHAASFNDLRAAMVRLRDEVDRIIAEGPNKCPYRNHQGTLQ